MNATADALQRDVEDGLRPSRDLLVILLGSFYDAIGLQKLLARALQERGLPYFVPSATRPNTLDTKYPNRDPNAFWYEGAVTLSRIHQAKGNEAEVVYVLGLDRVAEREDDISYRNQVFVALTRSKGWAHLSGVGHHPLFEETREVLESGTRFSFTFTRPPKRALAD